MRIKYYVQRERMKFRCMAIFYTQNVCAFPAFEQIEFMHDKIGCYESVVHIPGNLLAEGEYVVGISIFESRSIKLHYCRISDVIAFQVIDSLRGTSVRGDYAEGLGGVVRPFTKWEKNFLGQN